MKLPSSDLITVLLLKTFGLSADDVGALLPGDPTLWATGGFVQVASVGGSPGVHVPMRNPAVQIDCWTNRPNSEQAPWNKASDLAGQIVEGMYAMSRPVDLVMPADFKPVRVHSAYALSEPRPVPGDEAGFARISFDAALFWSWA